ncbi:MAG: ATPase [Bacteroidetes bacterium]|nr:ATPase [Bacteroidota bacterium]
MEQKTKVSAAPNDKGIEILREFELPVEALFQAFEDPEIFAQWMATEVLHMENRKYGSYSFQTKNPQGEIAFRVEGIYHTFLKNQQIIRTFEMIPSSFGVQLEHLLFQGIDNQHSRLRMQSIFQSSEQRDQLLKLPFAFGLNLAHHRLQKILQTK